ncbi:MAG: carboxypeptidase regulatory-like domain-containing protein [Bradymonadia bacterium]
MRRLKLTGALALASTMLMCAFAAAQPNVVPPDPPQNYPLDERCTVNILNRTAPVNAHGGFVLPNVPVDRGLYRARVICERNGVLLRGQSDLLTLEPNAETKVGLVDFTRQIPVPQALYLHTADGRDTLTEVGETVDLVLLGRVAPGGVLEGQVDAGGLVPLDGAINGTIYISSNPEVATVDDTGLVTAVSRGRVNMIAVNEGRVVAVEIEVDIPDDRDLDGLPDAFEIRNGLNPDDPADAALDLDGDGLSNLDEFLAGSSINTADTDGDGLLDGAEAALGTSPVRADTDDDGLLDGDEQARGTNATVADTDGDGIADGAEVDAGLDPTVADETTTVTGQVLSPDGAAVEGAVVIVARTYVTNTDADGTFSIDFVPTNRRLKAQVRYIEDGEAFDGTASAANPTPFGVTDFGTINLRPVLNAVGGQVLSPRGEPVVGAHVRVTVDGETRTGHTDRGGLYLIRQVQEGEVTVVATDPDTGLRGFAEGTLAADEALTVDVQLSASGTFEGQVYAQDGQPVGEGISVILRGPIGAETTTDALGRYRFDFVPLGRYSLEAFDDAGARGRTTAAISNTNQIIDAPISFLGAGQIVGRVESGAGAPAPGVQLVVVAQGAFEATLEGVSDAEGRFQFDGLPVGPVEISAIDPDSGLAGVVATTLDFNGDTAEVVITLRAAGSLVGTLYTAPIGGARQPAPGGSITLQPSGRTAATDATGRFRFDGVPLGAYTLVGALGADRGHGVANVDLPDGESETEVQLLGLGEVQIRVLDGGGAPVQGAHLTLNSAVPFEGAAFDQILNGFTDADGVDTLPGVLAGPFTVQAVDALNGLTGQVNSSVLPGEQVALTVRLEGAGAIVGQTLAPDGATPVPNLTVTVLSADRRSERTVTSDATGRFRFDLLPVSGSPYVLQAFDNFGALRSEAGDLQLAGHGDEITQDLVLGGTGSIYGLVFQPDETPAAGVRVTVESDQLGSPLRYATTDAAGAYRVDGVPEGAFVVTASNLAARRAATASGSIDEDAAEVEIDLTLEEDIIPPPPGDNPVMARLEDASRYPWTIRQDGSSEDGLNRVFLGNGAERRGALELAVRIAGGVQFLPFTARGGRFELDGRQVVLPGTALGDLQVSRKLYVPVDGYFVRALEQFENTGDEAISVDVRLQSHYDFVNRVRDGFTFQETARVVRDDNGDVTYTAADRWVALDDELDIDPFLVFNLPSVAHVLHGGAAENSVLPAEGSHTIFEDGSSTLETQWLRIDVPAGATVSLVHFAAQRASHDGAQAAASRLAQLPPEALAGLTEEERGQIVNFDLGAPVDLEPLPAIDGVIEGHALEGDGAPAPGGGINFKSAHPIFDRTWRVISALGSSDEPAAFTFVGEAGRGGRPVPVADFELWGEHPQSRLESPRIRASFPEESSTASADVIFEGTGRLTGEVRRAGGDVASVGQVEISGDAIERPLRTAIAIDGRYSLGGLPPGNYGLLAEVPIPGGTPVSGSGEGRVFIEQATTVNITLVPTGGITGFVLDGGGNPAIDVQLRLRGPDNFRRDGASDTGGRYAFLDLPVGDYTIEAFEPRTGVASTVEINIDEGGAIERNIDLVAIGRVHLTAVYPDGRRAIEAPIQIQRALLGPFFRSAGATNGQGELTLEGIPLGGFQIRALHPGGGNLAGLVEGAIEAHDQSLDLTVEIPEDLPPEVALLAPQSGAFLEGTQLGLRAEASDDLRVVRVEFLVNGLPVATDSAAPYTQTWVLPQGAPGDLTLVARAVDSGGNQTDSEPVILTRVDDDTPPVVAIAAPFEGAELTVGAPFTFTATATDDVAVEVVRFYVGDVEVGTDDTLPYRVQAVIPPNTVPGPQDLRVVAEDRAGLTTEATVGVVIRADEPPVIELVAGPEPNGTVVEGTPVTLEVDATDDVGVVVDVLFDGEVVATRSQAPFRFTPPAPATADGAPRALEITLRATDTAAQTAELVIPVQVTVDQPPQVVITAPAAEAEFVEGTTITVTADAEDDLAVAEVIFDFGNGLQITDDTPPYTATAPMESGDAGPTPIIVTAVDSFGQRTDETLTVIRLDDETPPTGAIVSPADGASLALGATDVIFVFGKNNRGDVLTEVDLDDDGNNDSLLQMQVIAARAMISALDLTSTQVALATYDVNARVDQSFSQGRDTLDTALALIPEGQIRFGAIPERGINAAVAHAIGVEGNRTAAPVIYLFAADDDDFDIDTSAAEEAGVIVHTVLTGDAIERGELREAAEDTGGRFNRLNSPEDVDALVDSVLVSADALRATIEADDDVAVRRVTLRATSADGAVQETGRAFEAPYEFALGLPPLPGATEITLRGEIADYSDTPAFTDPVTVTVLPDNAAPILLAAVPAKGVPGDEITLQGRFFSATPADNTVRFGDVAAEVLSASKIALVVRVPEGAQTGGITVEADGEISGPLRFGLDVDADGADDEEEAALGTDPNNPDTDSDGLLDGDEVPNGADPLDADTDDDGMSDGFEVQYDLNVTEAGDEIIDHDRDNLTSLEEFNLGTNPRDPDTDDDLLDDGEEVQAGSDPLDEDSDDGGTLDGFEVLEDGTNPLDGADDVPRVDLPYSLNDGNNYLWDVQGTGAIRNGTSDAYDFGLNLEINGARFPTFQVAIVEDDRELSMGPWAISGLVVRRKIFVPEGEAFARFLEVVENPGDEPVSATLEVNTNLGSDGNTVLVATSSGDATFDLTDGWLTTDDASNGGGDPSMAHVFAGTNGRLEPSALSLDRDNINYTFPLELAPGERVIVMHFAAQNLNRETALTSAQTLQALQGSTLAGLTADEQDEIANFFAFADADGDGLSDARELELGTGVNTPDTDGDGLLDGFEFRYGLDPLVPQAADTDTDGDGLPDLGEQARNADPTDRDSDDDTLEDGFEVDTSGTEPALFDTDGDGIDDGTEWAGPTDPTVADTDGDGLLDGEEVNRYRTDPNDPDTDGDGMPDGFEIEYDFEPTEHEDGAEDADRDGLTNAQEAQAGANPYNADTDFDDLTDAEEVLVHNTNPAESDTDGGGRRDAAEIYLDGTDPLAAGDDQEVFDDRHFLNDGEGFYWDLRGDGRVNNGTANAFDGGFDIRFNDGFFFESESGRRLNNREHLLGPWRHRDLLLSRAIFVPENDGFARYREIIINPTNQPQTATLVFNTDLGSDGQTEIVATSSGDQTFTIEDDWIITDDGDDEGSPAVVHVFSDAVGTAQPVDVSASIGVDDVTVTFEVVVPPNNSVVLMHFAAQQTTRAEALAKVDHLTGLLGATLDGLTPADQRAVANIVTFEDADDDGLSNEEELQIGTSPQNPDTDADGLLDGFEVTYGFDPLTGGDGPNDPDGDGLANTDEQNIGSSPLLADTDGDGLDDPDEVLATSDPNLPDTDGDGLLDGDEVNVHGTSPILADTDNGGLNDLEEITRGKDPLDPADDLLSGLSCEFAEPTEVDPFTFGFEASTDIEAPSNYVGSCGGDGPEVVFGLSVGEPSFIFAAVTWAEFDTVMYVRSSDCDNNLREVACNDDSDFGDIVGPGPGFGGEGEGGEGADPSVYSAIATPVGPGEIYIFLDGFDEFEAGAATIDISVEEGGLEE